MSRAMTLEPKSEGAELDFPAARAQLESELRDLLGSAAAGVELPPLTFEKGETRFAFGVPRIDGELLFEALGRIKAHIEHVRVHTFEPGYVIFQDLGSGVGPMPIGSIRFKFVTISENHRVEISKKGNLTQDEVQACASLFRIFHGGAAEKNRDPARELQQLGVQVYRAEGQVLDTDGSDAVASLPPSQRLAGYKKTKQEVLESVVLPLKRPEIFRGVSQLTRGSDRAATPRAVLFEGPPGVGKTTMARIVATETGIPLVYLPIENILSKYYGQSAQNLAAIFDAAGRYERVILFLDEIDSLAGSRDDGMFEATRRVLSVLLRKIDGFEAREGILTIGATNRVDDLDRALLSRFDSIIRFPLPGATERAQIFRSYARHLDQASLEELAPLSRGLSGRTIEDICELAERRWARLLIAEKKPASAPPAHIYTEVTAEVQARGESES